MKPTIISGNKHVDERGIISFNNDFNALGIKRIYLMENKDVFFIRGWQGHKIENRWFCATNGKFEVKLIKIDNWELPNQNLKSESFILTAGNMDVLMVPRGYITSIQSLETESKLLLMSDYLLGEVKDEYRFDINYFVYE